MLKKAPNFVLGRPSPCDVPFWHASVPTSFVLVLGLMLAAQPLFAAERFTVVLEGAGVKDNQTGLVWELEPDREYDVWSRSNERCPTKTVGGKTGWRAPSVQELKTLIDATQQDPSLPVGHPFRSVKSDIYWTSTPHPTDDIVAWQVSFLTGQSVTDQKSGTRRMWCVLGEAKSAR
jgi:hypothetical protein